MRDYILPILLMGLSACDAPVEQVRAQSVRWDSSPVEFTIRNNDDEVVTVRLAEVRGSEDEALRRQARNRLDALIDEAGGVLSLESPGAETDRYDRRLAHVYSGEGDDRVWFQGVLVSEGMLLVSSYADNRTHAATLLEMEDTARQSARGGWGNGTFKVLPADPNTLAQHLDSFQIIEGRIIDVSPVINDQVFLNFGFDWRTDFTVTVPADARTLFSDVGLDLNDLVDRRVRVRGWLQSFNGPSIRIDHPEALEILDPGSGASLPGLEP